MNTSSELSLGKRRAIFGGAAVAALLFVAVVVVVNGDSTASGPIIERPLQTTPELGVLLAPTATSQPAAAETAELASIPPSPCANTVPNDPADDPNPVWDGQVGRYTMSNNPIPDGYPTPLNTGFCGVGLSQADLEPAEELYITESGTVIDGLDINGPVHVQANNVTIRNSQITSTDRFALSLYASYSGLTIENTRIRGVGQRASTTVQLYGFASLRRVHISGGRDLMTARFGFLLEDSYLAGVYRTNTTRNNIIQVRTGNGYVIRRNSLIGPWQRSNSVLLFDASAGTGGGDITSALVTDNYISGGLYSIQTLSRQFSMNDSVVSDNRIEQDSWLFDWRSDTADVEYTDNTQTPS